MTSIGTISQRRLIPSDPVAAVGEALAASQRALGYRVCARCVMDTTHAGIEFDADGVCNFCQGYQQNVISRTLSPSEVKGQLRTAINEIRTRGKGREYDCILGVSGGVDSSYLALKCKEWGVRPLLVQFDNGWNTELANNNIQALCESLGFDLHTYVVDWQEFRELQLAFLKAGVANVEAPSDHGIFACLYRTAMEKKIPVVLTGVNRATESNCPTGEQARAAYSYGYRYDDLLHLTALHKRFGARPIETFPVLGYWHRRWLERSGKIRRFDLLNCLPYNKAEAVQELQACTGWRPYSGKHFESVFTRFHQSYILPVKFGMDKRRLHLSGLIWAMQLNRDQAADELLRLPCSPELLRQDYGFVIKKLNLTETDFLAIIGGRIVSFMEYPNQLWQMHLYQNFIAMCRKILRRPSDWFRVPRSI